jgi:hypothetical protein
MKKVLLLVAMLLSICSPVWAEANESGWTSVPKRTLGFFAGAVVGTPVCVVRKFKDEEINGTRGIAGDTSNPLLLIPAGAFWLPLALLYTGMEAPAYAIKNSWMADKPFSKEQFSLGSEQFAPAADE